MAGLMNDRLVPRIRILLGSLILIGRASRSHREIRLDRRSRAADGNELPPRLGARKSDECVLSRAADRSRKGWYRWRRCPADLDSGLGWPRSAASRSGTGTTRMR